MAALDEEIEKTNERSENIDTIFKRLELQGVNTNNPLLYGYYFVDNSKTKLEKIKDVLLGKIICLSILLS